MTDSCCLFCRSAEIKEASFPRPTFFNGKRFNYYQCNACNLIFIDPLPSNDDYTKMYSKTYHDQFYFKEALPDYNDMYKLLKKNSDKKTILDYGCGDGSFLSFFSEKGYSCTGVEYDKQLVDFLRNKFPAINFYTVEEFNSLLKGVKFDNIHLGDVFEHLTNPVEFTNGLRSRLNAKGLIVVEGPVENNFTLALTFRKFVSLFMKGKQANHVPYHIIFSNAANQKQIFSQNGFTAIYYKIYETSWPLPEKLSVKPVVALKWFIAKVSIIFSRIFPRMGNRFIYFGRKNS